MKRDHDAAIQAALFDDLSRSLPPRSKRDGASGGRPKADLSDQGGPPRAQDMAELVSDGFRPPLAEQSVVARGAGDVVGETLDDDSSHGAHVPAHAVRSVLEAEDALCDIGNRRLLERVQDERPLVEWEADDGKDRLEKLERERTAAGVDTALRVVAGAVEPTKSAFER